MTNGEVEQCIDEYIETIKPELREKFVYCFRHFDLVGDKGKWGNENKVLYGMCQSHFKPALITFFPNIMSYYGLPESEIHAVVNHEIFHTFNGASHEDIKKVEHSGRLIETKRPHVAR